MQHYQQMVYKIFVSDIEIIITFGEGVWVRMVLIRFQQLPPALDMELR